MALEVFLRRRLKSTIFPDYNVSSKVWYAHRDFCKKLFREIEYLAIYKNIGYRPVDIIIIIIKKSTNEFSAICIGLL